MLSGSPLKAAISTDNGSLVEWLLDHGADVNYGGGVELFWGSSDVGSPLMIAASLGNLEIVDRLLRAGAEVNLRFEENTMEPATALEAACKAGSVAVVNGCYSAVRPSRQTTGRTAANRPYFGLSRQIHWRKSLYY